MYTALHRTLAFAVLAAWALVCAGLPGQSLAAEAPPPVPEQKLVRGHWSEKPEIMRKNHQALLRAGMEKGTRSLTYRAENTLERCVTCHIVRDAQQAPVSAADPRHFCRSCHAKENVSLNCFTCHASRPASDPALMGAQVGNGATIKARLEEWHKTRQGGAAK